MSTRGTVRALWTLGGAAIVSLSFALTATADKGDRPPLPETSRPVGPDVRVGGDRADRELQIMGVLDGNSKPVDGAELVVKIDDATALKPSASRSGDRFDATLPGAARKVVIEVEHPLATGSVGVVLHDGPLTRVELYLVDGTVSAKMLPVPGSSIFGPAGVAGMGGVAGVGDCCMANGTPGCDDAECEAAVCACDAFCCDTEWDALCAGEGFVPGCGAAILCADLCENGGGGGETGADSCSEAEAIVGGGTFGFDTNGATTDGLAHAECLFFGNDQTWNDVWFCWTAEVDDDSVRLETCGLTTLDTKIVVYSACDVCPPGDELVLACNDDDCGLQSGLEFAAVAGGSYLIRIGSFSETGFGSGSFAVMTGGGGGGEGGTDNCADGPEAISGEGTFMFDNGAATTDGPPNDLCIAFGSDQVDNDVWFCWTADCDGDVRLETCGLTGVDTKIAVYDGCACDAPILACNDDTCGLQSRVTWTATAGNTYLIRIGTFPGAAGGTGSFLVECVTSKTICEQPAENCQDFATDNASQSNTTGFTSADDFGVTGPATVNSVCWWGAYLPGLNEDEFFITYYDDADGIPGNVVGGPFAQGVSLTVSGPVDTGALVAGVAPIWEYTGTHADVSLPEAGCYWIEIRNDSVPGTNWFWEWSFAGNNRVVVDAGPNGYDFGDITVGNDFAFCLNVELGDPDNCLPPPPGNDDCADAEAVAGQGTFPFNNGDATTDGPPSAVCTAFGSDQIDNDVWFCWTADCTGEVIFETCGLTGVDTKIGVYDGCGPCDGLGDPLACNDDSCGLQSSVQFGATAGQTYLLRIGTFPGAMGGAGAFSMTCVVSPDNDDCVDAIALDVPSQTAGSNLFAGDDDAPFCGTTVGGAGVWYAVTGTGTSITASFCPGPPPSDSDCCFPNGTPGCDDPECEATVCGVDSFCCDTEWDGICAGEAAELCEGCIPTEGGDANYDTTLHVYCGDCDNLICVGGNDDTCGLASEVTWCSQAGATYYILVAGFAGSQGDFVLNLTEDGAACTPDVGCAVTGACCIGADCVDGLTFEDCVAQGGEYQGDGTACGGGFAGYTDFTDCTVGYAPISGNEGPTGDDAALTVPIGFSFDFYGNTYTEITISTNGYLTFGPDGTDFSNDACPNPIDPNDLIAPYWDDFNLNDGGSITWNTFANPTRFMCEWTNVAEFGTGGANTATFQAILFPDGRIQYRYGDIACCAAAGDVTVGIENADGTDAVCIDHLGIGSGDCITIEPVFENPIECAFEDCNENGIPDDEELLPDYEPLEAEASDGPWNADYIGTDIYYLGNTIWATNDARIWCDLAYGGEYDVFYRYRPAASGTAAFKVCNFSFDLVANGNGLIELSFGLAGTDEEPFPVASDGNGRGCVTLNPVTLQLSWDIAYEGLSASPVGAHFHAGALGMNGPVVVPLTPTINDDGFGSGTIVGSTFINQAMADELLAGGWYVNLHTPMHPSGEIRGQVWPVQCLNDNVAFLSVHVGPTLEQIACNYMSQVGQNCGAIAYVEAGETYWIRIAGEADTRGWFELEVKGPRALLNPDDLNENGELDVCECIWDVNGDDVVDALDFDLVYFAMGSACWGCPEDVNADGIVDEQDLALVLSNYGPCPFPDDDDDESTLGGSDRMPMTPESSGARRR